MRNDQIRALAASYPSQNKKALFDLAQAYRTRHEREVLAVAAIAADVALDDVLDLGRGPDADPLLKDAFNRQYPNVDLESLAGASEERLDGLANGVKGKYFDMLVCDRLNAGERLGELRLDPGQTAHLAESTTQPGWDLRIENEDGSPDELLQLKATESMGYVKEALVKYPDIHVVVPSEVDAGADYVLGTDISNEQLDGIIEAQIGYLGDGSGEGLLDVAAETAFDSIPFVSMIFTGVIEGGRYLTGRSTLRQAFRRGARRMGKAGVYNALGIALGSTGVGIPVVMAMRVAEGRLAGRIDLADHLELKTLEIRRLTASNA